MNWKALKGQVARLHRKFDDAARRKNRVGAIDFLAGCYQGKKRTRTKQWQRAAFLWEMQDHLYSMRLYQPLRIIRPPRFRRNRFLTDGT